MRTDDLVELLARDVAPVPRVGSASRFGVALALSLPLAVAIMLACYGIRSDLATVLGNPMLWVKIGMPIAVMVGGLALVARLARPGKTAGWTLAAALLPVVALWLLGLGQAWALPGNERLPAMLGQTWRTCAFSIGLIALPVFVAAIQVLRSMAPTRPALAGAAAGWMAGGAGAAVYALHCPEMAAPFLAVWYVLGMALPAVIGALLGPRLLRW